MVKNFYQEYQQVLKSARMEQRDLHLLDVLEHLKFLDEDILRGVYNQNFLEKQQAYLQIKISLNA